MNQALYRRSINVIRDNQSNWGSYIASPAFPTYHYCWLRDGSFIAHAMDKAGEHASAAAYYRWVDRTILGYAAKVDDLRRMMAQGKTPGKDEVLHTRFSLDGKEVYVDDTWGNFQVDGYGTWLWALAEHVRMTSDVSILNEVSGSIELTLDYLALVWKLPNYDCWEEHPEFVHPYSLSAVYGGFQAIASLITDGIYPASSIPAAQLAGEVKDYVFAHGIVDGRLMKMIQPETMGTPAVPVHDSGVDASLMAAVFPYGMLSLDDDTARATMHAIEQELLRPDGGVYRYRADVYYGGGEWVLLTAWLGCIFAQTGRLAEAETLCQWIESCAADNGELPEQVSRHMLFPEYYQPWVDKWGPIASPLLWSHAMYILLVKAIEEGNLK